MRPSHVRPASGELSDAFGRIGGVRELADGRILVSDVLDKRIVVADLRSQRVAQVGRVGNGPREYASGGKLWPLGADTTLQADALARRWLLLVGDSIVMTVPGDNPAIVATQAGVYGTDRFGHVLGMQIEPLKPGVREIGLADSADVILASLATGRTDMIAKVRRIQQTYTGWEDVGGRPFYFQAGQAFYVGENVSISVDGWVAIVRLDPYRVDWRTPDGRTIRGAPIPYDVVKVTEREKQFYLKQNARAVNSVPNLPPALGPAQRAAVLAGLRRQWNDFPAAIPAFQAPGITAMSAEAAFIRRTASADTPDPVFDAVGRDGRLIARLQMAKGERIIGAGRGCIYVAAEDEDGLDHLRRHPWP